MIRQNLHTHTRFDDGACTPAEMAQAALDAGLTSLGFSGHSPLPWANDWTLSTDNLRDYLAAVADVKDAFAGRLAVYSGLEWDSASAREPDGFDYVIGSVHHLPVDGCFPSVDESPEATRRMLTECFHDDPCALAEAYFAEVRALAAAPFVDIVGHFDLLTKYDEKHGFFDETAPRYVDAAMSALEALVRADKLFEVNTGAIASGWRTAPYPSRRFLRELKLRGARIVVSSDAHRAECIACRFPEAEQLLRELGFRERWELTENGFAPLPLQH